MTDIAATSISAGYRAWKVPFVMRTVSNLPGMPTPSQFALSYQSRPSPLPVQTRFLARAASRWSVATIVLGRSTVTDCEVFALSASATSPSHATNAVLASLGVQVTSTTDHSSYQPSSFAPCAAYAMVQSPPSRTSRKCSIVPQRHVNVMSLRTSTVTEMLSPEPKFPSESSHS